MTPMNSDPLRRWLVEHATSRDDGLALFEGFCAALVAAGLPIWCMTLAIAAIEPTARGYRVEWRPGRPTTVFTGRHGPDGEADFARNPARPLIEDGRRFARWRLDALAPAASNPVLEEFAAEGGTDYVLHMVSFAPGTALRGMAAAFLTDRASGFSDDDLAFIAAVLPEFGLAMCKLALTRTLQETLAAYLGPASSAHVLDGQIRQGHGQTIAAAILLADLRGFTALTDREDPLRVVGWLNAHFDALGEPVARHGGEILKFLGDGFLAIFPVVDTQTRPCGICEAALGAAQSAMRANHALNARRRAAGEPTLEVDLVLHYGDVVYGNVGTSRRLDFTVIGRAVNEASRIEKLCEELGRSLLVSDAFATRCGSGLEPIGSVALRGLEHPQDLWAVPGAA